MTTPCFTRALADLTDAVTDYETAWRDGAYEGPYSLCASAGRRADAAMDALADHVGREQAECISRALIAAAASDRRHDKRCKGRSVEHLDRPDYTYEFIKEG